MRVTFSGDIARIVTELHVVAWLPFRAHVPCACGLTHVVPLLRWPMGRSEIADAMPRTCSGCGADIDRTPPESGPCWGLAPNEPEGLSYSIGADEWRAHLADWTRARDSEVVT